MKLYLAQALVRARCHGMCEGCGKFGDVQVHHRRARGIGGVNRAAQDHADDPRNMLALCPSCHAKTEHADTWRECEGLGWRVEHGVRDPYEVPAFIWTVNTVGPSWQLLDENGGYHLQDLPADHRVWIEEIEAPQ